MSRGGGLRYYIDGDTSGLQRALGHADRSIAGVGNRLATGVLRTGAIAGAAALTGLALAARTGFSELTAAQNAMAQTESRLRSTGGAANVTAGHVAGLASRLQALTGIEDDLIHASENVLLTFTNIRNAGPGTAAVFDRATKAVLDMSVALDQDMRSASIQIGKALNDPIRGVTALGRAGVQFTEQQKEQIRTMVESGRTLDAQRMILSELERQMGGAAAAAGTTLTGKWERLKRAGEGITESLVRGTLPALESMADVALQEVVPRLDQAAGQIERIWSRPGLDFATRLSRSWDAIARTGLPEQAKEALYSGLEAVGTAGPRLIVKGLQEAPWPAKAVIAGILVAKLGPAISLLGPAIGRALGGAGTGLGGVVASRGAPVPVIVMNPGFTGAPGGSGGPMPVGGAQGVLRALGLGGLAIGGLAAGGTAISRLNDRHGFFSPSREESRRFVDQATERMLDAWREKGPAAAREIARLTSSPMGRLFGEQWGRQTAGAAQKAIDRMVDEFGDGRGKIRGGAQRFIREAVAGLSRLEPQARVLASDSMVTFAQELERKGRLPRGATSRLISAMEREFGRLPASIRAVADAVRGIGSAANTALTGVSSLASRLFELPVPGGRAMGGYIPGRFDGRDDVLVRASRGEVILNPSQQRMVGIDRIVSALRATGGIVGGDGAAFRSGGIIGEAYRRALSKMGTAYEYGVWDCSDFATYVAGVDVGGSTATAWSNSRPARGQAIVWGFRNVRGDTTYDGGKDEHMGVGIRTPRGTYVWFDNGSGGVQSNADSARWQHVRVPKGLERVFQDGEGGVGLSDDTKRNTRGRGRQITPTERVVRALRALGVGDQESRSAAARRLIAPIPDLANDDDPGASLSGPQARGASAAGRKARAQARAAGLAPDEVARRGEEAERQAEVTFLLRNMDAEQSDLAALANRKRATLRDFQRLGRKRVHTAEARKRKQALMEQYRQKLAALTEAMADVREVIAQIKERLRELGEDVEAERYQEQYDASQAPPTGEDGTGDTGPSADQQAQLDQATRRAEVAERQALAGEAFIRAIGSSSDIDPATGSVTIIVNAPGGLVHEQEVGRWVVEALRGQGAPGASVSRSAA